MSIIVILLQTRRQTRVQPSTAVYHRRSPSTAVISPSITVYCRLSPSITVYCRLSPFITVYCRLLPFMSWHADFTDFTVERFSKRLSKFFLVYKRICDIVCIHTHNAYVRGVEKIRTQKHTSLAISSLREP